MIFRHPFAWRGKEGTPSPSSPVSRGWKFRETVLFLQDEGSRTSGSEKKIFQREEGKMGRKCSLHSWIIILSFIIFLAPALPAYSGNFSFKGVVYDAADGTPIKGAQVIVGNDYFDSANISVTDASGNFEVEVSENADDYTVLVYAPGYVSQDLILQRPSSGYKFYLDKPLSGHLVQTVNEGLRHYENNGTFNYRVDGTVVEDTRFFPDIDRQSSDIDSFLALIVSDTSETRDPALIWEKCRAVWSWLHENGRYQGEDPAWQDASDFLYQD
ncbi:MAG: carboxypeptidase regulatory-like domain-containing protein, partial [Deltaproteobacteria bacterium]